jgi:hypothetical protein
MDSKSIALVYQNSPVNEIHNTNENFPNAWSFRIMAWQTTIDRNQLGSRRSGLDHVRF